MGTESLRENPPDGTDTKSPPQPRFMADPIGILLWPLHHLIWSNPQRRARKLLEFAEVEASGGRDLVRAAELTPDARLRERYLHHARDEARHADMFRAQGRALRGSLNEGESGGLARWAAPGEQGMDGLDLAQETDADLLAFLHLSESAAARDFARYARATRGDTATSGLFRRILRDEDHHMRYTHAELVRVAPGGTRRRLWWARLRRLWKAYLRFATALAGLIAGVVLTLQYFLLLPPFAWAAKRAARRERPGWVDVGQGRRR